jgi:hypothetical protein
MSGNATSRTLFVAVFAFAAGAAVYASAVDYFFGNSSQPAVTATKINPDDPHGNPADTHESENIVRRWLFRPAWERRCNVLLRPSLLAESFRPPC